ncbi:uncharacterized protein LOC136072362 [Hydra vulgaris]|uniref:uncharacterized protein LOC136072362 n=1 Tax=Hydra vulgaris TaxID=6087 RepID=UPI0032EA6BEC
MLSRDILNITKTPLMDSGFIDYEYKEYEPQNPNYNGTVPLKIIIPSNGLFYHPYEAFLHIEGSLVKAADGAAYADADAISLINNGIMYLFDSISYRLSEVEIERVDNVGQATTMIGMLKYSNDFQLSEELNQLWYKDSTTTADLTANAGFAVRQSYLIQKAAAGSKGSFSFCIPLKHIFGFCDDYDKVIFGIKHSITLVKKVTHNNAIFRDNAVAAGKVNFTKISLCMPIITLSDVAKAEILSEINKKVPVPVSFHSRTCESLALPQTTSLSWKVSIKSNETPRFVIVALQTNKDEQQTKNPAIFDHCNLRNMQAIIDKKVYPLEAYQLSFPSQ